MASIVACMQHGMHTYLTLAPFSWEGRKRAFKPYCLPTLLLLFFLTSAVAGLLPPGGQEEGVASLSYLLKKKRENLTFSLEWGTVGEVEGEGEPAGCMALLQNISLQTPMLHYSCTASFSLHLSPQTCLPYMPANIFHALSSPFSIYNIFLTYILCLTYYISYILSFSSLLYI